MPSPNQCESSPTGKGPKKQETQGEELSQEENWWKMKGCGVRVEKEIAKGWSEEHWVLRGLAEAAWCAGLYSEIEVEEEVHVASAQVAGTLAVTYPPPADLGHQFGQGREDFVEERSYNLVEAAF